MHHFVLHRFVFSLERKSSSIGISGISFFDSTYSTASRNRNTDQDETRDNAMRMNINTPNTEWFSICYLLCPRMVEKLIIPIAYEQPLLTLSRMEGT